MYLLVHQQQSPATLSIQSQSGRCQPAVVSIDPRSSGYPHAGLRTYLVRAFINDTMVGESSPFLHHFLVIRSGG
jgi:hypothetical protein